MAAGIGVTLSVSGMAAAFRGPQRAHWRRLALTHGALGAAALLADRSLRPRVPRRDDVLVGIGVGVGLFVASSLADALAPPFPRLENDVGALASLSLAASPGRMCGYLAVVIAPGEELLWRGLLQGQLTRRYGPRDAAILTSVIYGAAHVPTGNSAVTGAALGLGSVLSLMRANGAGIERLALAHACWVVPTLLRERARTTRTLRQAGPGLTRKIEDERTARSMDPTGRRVSPLGKRAQLTNNSVHTALYEKTRGQLGARMLGNQVGILTTARRDGQPYAVPLFVFRDGADVIVVASYRGSIEHPVWFRNLLANPVARIQIRNRAWGVQATVLDPTERAAWWERVVRKFDGYAEYQRRTSREIPIVRLTPQQEAR